MLYKIIYRLFTTCFVIAIITASTLPIPVYSTVYSGEYNKSIVLDRGMFYGLPAKFSSVQRIQAYLESTGTFLATMTFPVTFEPDSAVISPTAFAHKEDRFNAARTYNLYKDQNMTFAQLIWNMSRTQMGNSCNLVFNNTFTAGNICYDNNIKPINPGFLLAMIQKESGLIYGRNAQLNPNDANTQFLLDRILGYFCFENPDRSKSCFDENPDWKYFKGVFRQVYYAVRLIRIREQTCTIGGSVAFTSINGRFEIGSIVTINGEPLLLSSGLACAMYIYTPHLSSQRLVWTIMREIGAFDNVDMNIQV